MMNNYITEVDILDEAKDNFLTYAEEVLTDRAVPNAEDGLLSSQRKLLWTAEQMLKMNSKGKTKKCASLVGSCLSSVYTHGDQACYGVLCKMAQPYLMRYPLFDAIGNIGSQEANGMEAAPRYSEAKPSIYADLMFKNFDKKVVPEKLSYNNEYMEPIFLPSSFPNALVNGKETIAISLSHVSLPNNLTEVCNGIIEYIKNPVITLDELMKYIKGPDFPLGGTVINSKDIYEAYNTGRSAVSLKVRGDYEIDEKKGIITFTTIPYRTYRNKIKEQISKNIDTLDKYFEDFNDESSVGVNRLVFDLKKGIDANEAVEKLFALTDLQTTLSYNMNYIVNGTPRLCSLLDLIDAYCKHQHNVITRAAQYDKEKAEARLHILEGLISAVDKIDDVIKLIKSSKDRAEAATGLMAMLKINEVQAKAILDMRLGKLTKIDKNELIQEKKEKENIIAECSKIISDFDYRDELLIQQVKEIKNKYGDERRTKLENIEIKKANGVAVPFNLSINESGFAYKVAVKTQTRGGKGVKCDPKLVDILDTNSHEVLSIFTAKGKMYNAVAAEGKLVDLDVEDKVVKVTAINNDIVDYLVFLTKNGMIKKTSIDEYNLNSKRKAGIAAIKLKNDDEVVDVLKIEIDDNDDDKLVVCTKNGFGIRFNSKEVSASGRNTIGTKAIDLKDSEAIGVSYDTHKLMIINENGYGKIINSSEIPLQAKGGVGVHITKDGEKVLRVENVVGKKEVYIKNPFYGRIIKVNVTDFPEISRTALGNKIIEI